MTYTKIDCGRRYDGGIWIVEYIWDNSLKQWQECGRVSLTPEQYGKILKAS